MAHHSRFNIALPLPGVGTGAAVLGYLLFSQAVLLGDLDNWSLKLQLETAENSRENHGAMLRQLAPYLSPPPTLPGSEDAPAHPRITISSDRPALVFIDDMLVQQSPVILHPLPTGTHKIRISSCPEIGAYGPGEKVHWLDYWSVASDGSCDYPEDPMEGMIAKPVSETDGVVYSELVRDPAVNFCCDAGLVKEFEVEIRGGNPVFVWSFESGSWVQESFTN